MDRKFRKSPEIDRLLRLSESARDCLEHEVISLKQRLDVPTRIRESLKNHPAGWLMGSIASGLTASMVFRRKPAPEKKSHRGLPLTLLGITFSAVRPLAKAWLTNQVKQYLARTQTDKSVRPSKPNSFSDQKNF